jgi:hypothetical protein
VLRSSGFLALVAAVVVVLAGCGGGGSSSPTASTRSVSAQGELAYERSFSECASFTKQRLATKYHVKATDDALVRAVGTAWANRYGGGVETLRISRAGCRDGLSSRAPAS